MRVIRTSGQDAVPMQQMQGQSMQPMPTMPEQGYEQREFYLGAYIGMKMQVQMQQEQQSTHALDSAGSSTLHQIPEEHHERTGGQTGLDSVVMHKRPPGDEDEDSDGYRVDYSESEEATAYSAGDMLKNIVADRAVEEH